MGENVVWFFTPSGESWCDNYPPGEPSLGDIVNHNGRRWRVDTREWEDGDLHVIVVEITKRAEEAPDDGDV